jgi:hypothetical protein
MCNKVVFNAFSFFLVLSFYFVKTFLLHSRFCLRFYILKQNQKKYCLTTTESTQILVTYIKRYITDIYISASQNITAARRERKKREKCQRISTPDMCNIQMSCREKTGKVRENENDRKGKLSSQLHTFIIIIIRSFATVANFLLLVCLKEAGSSKTPLLTGTPLSHSYGCWGYRRGWGLV